MPRYFFDLCDAGGVSVDDDGLELPDLAAATAEARRTLLAMFEEPPHPGSPLVTMVIRQDDEVVAAVDNTTADLGH